MYNKTLEYLIYIKNNVRLNQRGGKSMCCKYIFAHFLAFRLNKNLELVSLLNK